MVKPNIGNHAAEWFSWVSLSYFSPPGALRGVDSEQDRRIRAPQQSGQQSLPPTTPTGLHVQTQVTAPPRGTPPALL